MKITKWEYSLNAIHYCIWLMDIRLDNCVHKLMDKISILISKCFFTKSFQKKWYERRENNQKELNSFFYNRVNGYHIGWANYWFGYLYSSYPGVLSFIIVGIADKIIGTLNIAMFAMFFGTPIVLCYIPAYKAVFSKDKYLKYFKEFEKKDMYWHRKWKWITISFCIGAVIMTILGIVAMSIAGHLS